MSPEIDELLYDDTRVLSCDLRNPAPRQVCIVRAVADLADTKDFPAMRGIRHLSEYGLNFLARRASRRASLIIRGRSTRKGCDGAQGAQD